MSTQKLQKLKNQGISDLRVQKINVSKVLNLKFPITFTLHGEEETVFVEFSISDNHPEFHEIHKNLVNSSEGESEEKALIYESIAAETVKHIQKFITEKYRE